MRAPKKLKILALVATLIVGTPLLTSCGGGGTGSVIFPLIIQYLVIGDGLNVNLYRLDENYDSGVIATAAIPTDTGLVSDAIFGITKHPTKQELYVHSLVQKDSDLSRQWGNAR